MIKFIQKKLKTNQFNLMHSFIFTKNQIFQLGHPNIVIKRLLGGIIRIRFSAMFPNVITKYNITRFYKSHTRLNCSREDVSDESQASDRSHRKTARLRQHHESITR